MHALKNWFSTMSTRDIKLLQAVDHATGKHHLAEYRKIALAHDLTMGFGKSTQLHIMQMSADATLKVWQTQAGCGAAAFPPEMEGAMRIRCDLSLFLHRSFRVPHWDWDAIQLAYAITEEEFKELVRHSAEIVVKLNSRLTPTVWTSKCYPLTTNTRSGQIVGGHLVRDFQEHGETGTKDTRGLEEAQGTTRQLDAKAVPPTGRKGERSVSMQTLSSMTKLSIDGRYGNLRLALDMKRARASHAKTMLIIFKELVPRVRESIREAEDQFSLPPESCPDPPGWVLGNEQADVETDPAKALEREWVSKLALCRSELDGTRQRSGDFAVAEGPKALVKMPELKTLRVAQGETAQSLKGKKRVDIVEDICMHTVGTLLAPRPPPASRAGTASQAAPSTAWIFCKPEKWFWSNEYVYHRFAHEDPSEETCRKRRGTHASVDEEAEIEEQELSMSGHDHVTEQDQTGEEGPPIDEDDLREREERERTEAAAEEERALDEEEDQGNEEEAVEEQEQPEGPRAVDPLEVEAEEEEPTAPTSGRGRRLKKVTNYRVLATTGRASRQK